MTQPAYPLAPGEVAPSLALPFTGAPSPWESPTLWDAIYISGVPWVGRVRVRGARRSYKWDVKSPPGIEGFNQTYRGKPHKNFHIDFFIWTDSMFRYFTGLIVPLFQYVGVAGVVLPVKVYHPSLTPIGITAIVCDEIGAIEPADETGLYVCSIEVHEFYPPLLVNVTTTPVAAVGVNPASPGVPSASAVALQAVQAAAQARQAASLSSALP